MDSNIKTILERGLQQAKYRLKELTRDRDEYVNALDACEKRMSKVNELITSLKKELERANGS